METPKIGDIVVCPRAGWWKVKEVDARQNNRFILEMVMDKKGNVPKKKARVISAYKNWVVKVTEDEVKKNKEQEINKWDKLLMILNPKAHGEIPEFEKPEPDFLINLTPPQSLLKKK